MWRIPFGTSGEEQWKCGAAGMKQDFELKER